MLSDLKGNKTVNIYYGESRTYTCSYMVAQKVIAQLWVSLIKRIFIHRSYKIWSLVIQPKKGSTRLRQKRYKTDNPQNTPPLSTSLDGFTVTNKFGRLCNNQLT